MNNSITQANQNDKQISKSIKGFHKVLDIFARCYCPVPKSPGLGYTWAVQQIECATDIMFHKQEYLEPFYDEIIHTAIFTVKPDNIATFPRQRITYNCLITAPKRLVRIIISAFSARGSNTIWVMYQSKCMTGLAASYGLKAPVMLSVRSTWNGKPNTKMEHLISGKLL